MPFINKDISLVEFIQNVRIRILRSKSKEAEIFFNSFLGDSLVEEIKPNLPADWNGLINAGEFDILDPLVVVEILFDAATRNSSEGHGDIYRDASAVSFAFCEELNEVFQCSGDEIFNFIPIKSFSEIMAELG